MVKKYYEAKNALALVVNILPRPPPPAILFWCVRFMISEEKIEGTCGMWTGQHSLHACLSMHS